jgi:hypothetical protein
MTPCSERWSRQWLNKDLERHKSALKAAVDLENERLRSSLQIVAAEHSIILTRVQEKRAAVIGGIYALLAKAIALTTSYVHVAQWAGELSTILTV